MQTCVQCLYTIFPVISSPGAHLVIQLSGGALIGGWCLKECGTYFKVR